MNTLHMIAFVGIILSFIGWVVCLFVRPLRERCAYFIANLFMWAFVTLYNITRSSGGA